MARRISEELIEHMHREAKRYLTDKNIAALKVTCGECKHEQAVNLDPYKAADFVSFGFEGVSGLRFGHCESCGMHLSFT